MALKEVCKLIDKLEDVPSKEQKKPVRKKNQVGSDPFSREEE
jgi:hypothetical protein